MKKILRLSLLAAVSLVLCSCGSKETLMKVYDVTSQQSEFSYFEPSDLSVVTPFAADLCVVSENKDNASVAISAEAASIYCVDDKEVIYAKNVHSRMNPASLTKIMTALLALESGKLEDTVVITEEAMISESDATVCNLKVGDTLTLRQLVNGALIRSGNDAASAIGIHLAGSLEAFNTMMNERAKQLGATNTNFTNPHGLTNEQHYTTAYDMYLIMNEAMKSEEFLSIISQKEYVMVFTDAEGNARNETFSNTNRYISGRTDVPEGITVIGGKTGTTNAAGSCLALVSRNAAGKSYCSIILKAESSDVLFTEMTDLLKLEN